MSHPDYLPCPQYAAEPRADRGQRHHTVRSPTDVRVRSHFVNTLFVFGLPGLAVVMEMTVPYLEMTEPLTLPAASAGDAEGRLHRVNIYE